MQAMVGDVCVSYFARMRKHVYVTPKTFLCLIDFYKGMYRVKYDEVNNLEQSVNVGLEKLASAAKQVDEMKVRGAVARSFVVCGEEEKFLVKRRKKCE